MSILDRISQAHAALTATKAGPAAPVPGELYPVPMGYTPSVGMGLNIPTYPLTWEGSSQYAAQIGKALTDEQRQRVAIVSSWVYSDINAIAQEISTATLIMKRQQLEGETDIEAHPMERLWEKPNPFMGRSFMMQFWAWQLLLSGEGYFFCAPDKRTGEIVEIWPVPSLMIEPIPSEDEFISGFLFRARPDRKPIPIDRRYIIYSRIPHPFDLRRGLSPLVAAFLSTEIDLAQARWNRSFFSERNATPTSVISMPRDMGKPDFLRVVTELKELFGGAKGGTLYTRAGEIDIKQLSMNPEQMQFISMRAQNRDEIDRVFGIPGGYWSGQANRANAQHGNAVFISQAVWPKLVLLSEDMNAQHTPIWYGPDVSAEFEDIRPRNIELDLRQRDSRKQYLTINELRVDDGYSELDDDDPRGRLFVAQLQPEAPAGEADAPTKADTAATGTTDQGRADAVPEPAPEAADTQAELKRWERKAIKALRREGRAAVGFTSAAISSAERARISIALKSAQTADQVRAIFHATKATTTQRIRASDLDALLDDEVLSRVEELLAGVQA